MIEQQTLPLLTFYQGWENSQQNIIEMIAPLTAEQLAAHVTPHHWPVARLAQHLVFDRVWWFQTYMGAGDPALASLVAWDEDDAPLRSAEEIVSGLQSTWQMVHDALSKWTVAELEDVIPTPASLTQEEQTRFSPRTRRWIIWHVLEHELMHAGELSAGLGEAGLGTFYNI